VPEDVAQPAIEYICTRLTRADDRGTAFEALCRDQHSQTMPDVNQRAWLVFLPGITNGCTSHQQYSVLVTVVILSAFVPALIAQQWFEPELEDTVGEEDLTQLHRHHHASSHLVLRAGRTSPGLLGNVSDSLTRVLLLTRREVQRPVRAP
jgi:hypothetical protein